MSAYYLRNAILVKDAIHPIQEDTGPTLELAMEKLSEYILNTQHNFCNQMDNMLKDAMIETLTATTEINKKFFNKVGTIMQDMANAACAYVCLLIEKKRELKTFAAQHYEEAKNSTSITIANNVYPMLGENKKILITFSSLSTQ